MRVERELAIPARATCPARGATPMEQSMMASQGSSVGPTALNTVMPARRVQWMTEVKFGPTSCAGGAVVLPVKPL